MVIQAAPSGPGNRVTQADLENLCKFGFKQEFRAIGHTAQAAKLRVAFKNEKDITRMHNELQKGRGNSLNTLSGLRDRSLLEC